MNILDGEPMEDSQVCGISRITKVNNTFDPDVCSNDDEPNNLIYKWTETKSKQRCSRP